MARSRQAREELERIPKLIERYKQTALEAAFSGDWEYTPLGDLIEGIEAGKNLRCEERPPLKSEKGVVKVSAVTWGIFQSKESKTLPADFTPDERTRIQVGDFLISRANTIELVGACVIVEDDPANLFLSDKILRLKMPDSLKPWVLWYLRSPEGRWQIQDLSTGNQLSMRNISQGNLKSIPVPMPSEHERKAILVRLAAKLSAISSSSQEGKRASVLLSKLEQGTLNKAFQRRTGSARFHR